MSLASLWERSFVFHLLKKTGDSLRRPLASLAPTSLLVAWLDSLLQLLLLLLLFLMPFISSGKIALLVFLSFILWIGKGLTQKEEWSPKLDSFSLLFLIWIGLSLLSVGFSPYFLSSLKGYAKWLVYLTAYLLFLFNFNTQERRERAIFTVSLSALIVSLYAVWQGIVGVEPLALWEDIEAMGEERVRVYSTLMNPNLLGGYLIGFLPLCFALLLSRRDWRRPLLALSFISSVLALLWTYSRGAYLGFFFSFLAFFLFLLYLAWRRGNRRVRVAVLLFLLFFVLLSVVGVMVSPSLKARVASIASIWGHTSNLTRVTIWEASLRMFRDHWLLGIGPGNDTFRQVYAFYMRPRFNSLASYNIFLEIGIENGILGLLVFLGMLYLLFRRGWERLSQERISRALILIGAMSACLAPLFHGLVDTIWYRPQPQLLFWLAVSLIVGEEKGIKRVLALNFGGIGDQILFLPTIGALRKLFPQCYLVMLTEPRSKEIFRGKVDEIIALDVKKGVSPWKIFKSLSYIRYLQPDVAVASGTSAFLPLFLYFTGARIRVGYKQSKLHFLNTHNADATRNDYMAFVHYRLAQALGAKEPPSLPRLDLPDSAREWARDYLRSMNLSEGFILIHPGIARMSIERGIDRRWEVDKWVELINILRERGNEVLVSMGPDEGELGEELRRRVGFPLPVVQPEDIYQLGGLIEKSALLVCLDSAPMHVGVALGKKVVALFGPSDEEEVLPKDERFRAVYADIDCRPCLWDKRRTSCPELHCMKKIKVEDVLKAIEELLK